MTANDVALFALSYLQKRFKGLLPRRVAALAGPSLQRFKNQKRTAATHGL
jgi:hypothetical protein